MTDLSFIEQLLKAKKIRLAGPLIQDHVETDRFVAFIFASSNDDKKKGPSQLTLSAISAAAERQGIQLGFVLIDKKSEEFDGSIKTLLFTKFQNIIRNSFTVVNYKRASVWVEPKKRIDPEMMEEIRKFLREFFTLLDIDDVSVFFTHDEDIPTPTVILRSLRIIAPCSAASLSRSLEEKCYKVPNEVWMAHALDRLRKAGSVVRKANGQFFLSLEGLRRLGTEKSRASPDIKRALALGKKDS